MFSYGCLSASKVTLKDMGKLIGTPPHPPHTKKEKKTNDEINVVPGMYLIW